MLFITIGESGAPYFCTTCYGEPGIVVIIGVLTTTGVFMGLETAGGRGAAGVTVVEVDAALEDDPVVVVLVVGVTAGVGVGAYGKGMLMAGETG